MVPVTSIFNLKTSSPFSETESYYIAWTEKIIKTKLISQLFVHGETCFASFSNNQFKWKLLMNQKQIIMVDMLWKIHMKFQKKH